MVKDGVPIAYTYDANNKMLTAGGDTYTYDLNGNTIARTGSSGNATWGYDFENRMVSSTTPLGSASFVYNGDGLRVRKVEGAWTGNYLFNGVRVYAKYDDSWSEQARFMIEGASYYDQLVATRTGGAWYYPLYDALGSARRLINASQSVTDTYSYDAFGNVTSQSGSTYNPYRYVGALGYYSADYTTGLLHLGARYYNPSAGRFATSDPKRRPDRSYTYAENAATAGVDPTGLWCLHLPLNICIGTTCKDDPGCPGHNAPTPGFPGCAIGPPPCPTIGPYKPGPGTWVFPNTWQDCVKGHMPFHCELVITGGSTAYSACISCCENFPTDKARCQKSCDTLPPDQNTGGLPALPTL